MQIDPTKIALKWLKKAAPYLFEGVDEYSLPGGVQSSIIEYRSKPVDYRSTKSLLWFLLGKKGTPPFKYGRVEAFYTENSPHESTCANCMSIYTHDATGVKICDQIRGEIQTTGWCRFWEKPVSVREYRRFQEG